MTLILRRDRPAGQANGLTNAELDGNAEFLQQLAVQAQAAADAAAAAASMALTAATRPLTSADIEDFATATRAFIGPDLVSARDRENHTGTQLAATISDFTASARAVVLDSVLAGDGVTITIVGGRLVISANPAAPQDLGVYIERDYIDADYIE